MLLQFNDLIFIIGFFAFSLAIGFLVSRRAGSNSVEYFAGGRNMPWWLLGISMVATTFSTDSPNLVTDFVRNHGVSGNWVWFAFLITGMVTVFIYAKLWKRSNVLTDIEFYELRYSGKAAAFLRGFRAVYLGFFFNIMIMASVSLAAIKIGSVLLGISPFLTIVIAGVIVVVYSALGGLRGVLITDFFQFFIAMFGAVAVAYIAVKEKVGGLDKLFENEIVKGKLSILPDFTDLNTLMALFIIPIAVQWWSVWYPGSEPGGGGYIAQRMFAARDEKHAIGATLLFNIVHYALRPWPWIMVALASLVVFPDLESLRQAFPNIDPAIIDHDLAYPAMVSLMPHGLLGLVVASLIAAYMSTISTHLNWGSSYLVNDFYKRFVKPDASEKELVRIGRISTILLMFFAGIFALLLKTALQAFSIMLQIGAGTGLIFLLRWFWWRINAFSEITAMVVSFCVAIYFELIHGALGFSPLEQWQKLTLSVMITTISWITVTFLTRPTDDRKLLSFIALIRPGGPGWKKFLLKTGEENLPVSGGETEKWDLPSALLNVFLGCMTVYSIIFATGFWLYSQLVFALIATSTALIAGVALFLNWRRIRTG